MEDTALRLYQPTTIVRTCRLYPPRRCSPTSAARRRRRSRSARALSADRTTGQSANCTRIMQILCVALRHPPAGGAVVALEPALNRLLRG
jgi:hypothetical protein